MTAPIRQCGSSQLPGTYQHRQRERHGGGREVQGWWLKFMCHALILMWESTAHTHTYTQDRGKRKGQRSRSVSLWCAVSNCMCVFWVTVIQWSLSHAAYSRPLILYFILSQSICLSHMTVYTMNILNASTQTFWVNKATFTVHFH